MSDEEKQTFLRENILDKGYDTNLFVEFLINKKGECGADVSNWSMADLQIVVKEFITMQSGGGATSLPEEPPQPEQQQPQPSMEAEQQDPQNQKTSMSDFFTSQNQNQDQQVNQQIPQDSQQQPQGQQQQQPVQQKQQEAAKGKEVRKTAASFGIIARPSMDCKNLDNTPLSSVENAEIFVGYPEKVEGGFFSKSYVTYLITTSPLNLKVRRRYSDFDWLRYIITPLFSSSLIPPTPKKNKIGGDRFGEAFLLKRMRSLEKFMNYLLTDPLIKNSQLFYDFISIENEADFSKKKKEYEKLKPVKNLQEIKHTDGKINIEVNSEKEIYFENIKDNVNLNENVIRKIKQ